MHANRTLVYKRDVVYLDNEDIRFIKCTIMKLFCLLLDMQHLSDQNTSSRTSASNFPDRLIIAHHKSSRFNDQTEPWRLFTCLKTETVADYLFHSFRQLLIRMQLLVSNIFNGAAVWLTALFCIFISLSPSFCAVDKRSTVRYLCVSIKHKKTNRRR